MAVGILQYDWKISATIRKATKQGVISQNEDDYLQAMVAESVPASSTVALINAKGAPDFLYAALFFATLVWQSGEVAGCDTGAQAGYKLATFVLQDESPEHDPHWAANLLRGLYDAHQEAA